MSETDQITNTVNPTESDSVVLVTNGGEKQHKGTINSREDSKEKKLPSVNDSEKSRKKRDRSPSRQYYKTYDRRSRERYRERSRDRHRNNTGSRYRNKSRERSRERSRHRRRSRSRSRDWNRERKHDRTWTPDRRRDTNEKRYDSSDKYTKRARERSRDRSQGGSSRKDEERNEPRLIGKGNSSKKVVEVTDTPADTDYWSHVKTNFRAKADYMKSKKLLTILSLAQEEVHVVAAEKLHDIALSQMQRQAFAALE